MKKQRLMELAGLVKEAGGGRSVSELDRAVKDKAAYKQFISSMDILLSDWYADGFTKQDVVNYMNQVLPASEPSNTSSSNDMPGFAGTRDALANI